MKVLIAYDGSGEMILLTGESGSGKSVLLRLAMGS